MMNKCVCFLLVLSMFVLVSCGSSSKETLSDGANKNAVVDSYKIYNVYGYLEKEVITYSDGRKEEVSFNSLGGKEQKFFNALGKLVERHLTYSYKGGIEVTKDFYNADEKLKDLFRFYLIKINMIASLTKTRLE